MYEVEVKVEADHDAVRERLDALDAEFLGTVRQSDTYYDAPHRDFAETDEAFRIRRETVAGGEDGGRGNSGGADDGETHAELTYKGPKVDAESKTREEIETRVESGEAADGIARALGFEPAAVVEKERDRYRLDGYTVTLDSVEGAGTFVEVETEAEAVEAARDGAKEVLVDLGLDPGEGIRTSYLGLLLDDAEQ